MAKGAAKVETLGALHDAVAQLFIKVLHKMHKDLDDAMSPKEVTLNEEGGIDKDALAEAVMAEALSDGMPSPAMLAAITKFLKDNDIGYDAEVLEEMSALERQLQDKARKRPAGLTLVDIPPVAADGS